MRPHIAAASRVADTLVAAFPNAGLPNEMGEYDEKPHETAGELGKWAEEGIAKTEAALMAARLTSLWARPGQSQTPASYPLGQWAVLRI